MPEMEEHYDVVVIGSGFGGSMTALGLARALKARGRGERVLMLERGTWWTTPVSTVQDKQVKTYGFLRDEKRQPVQLWSSAENFRGFVDLYTRCVRRKRNEDGLYDLTAFGRKGLFGLRRNDGVTILRACGAAGRWYTPTSRSARRTRSRRIRAGRSPGPRRSATSNTTSPVTLSARA